MMKIIVRLLSLIEVSLPDSRDIISIVILILIASNIAFAVMGSIRTVGIKIFIIAMLMTYHFWRNNRSRFFRKIVLKHSCTKLAHFITIAKNLTLLFILWAFLLSCLLFFIVIIITVISKVFIRNLLILRVLGGLGFINHIDIIS